ncbi:MAG: hypothetical protein ACE5DK_11580, partial [Paracoccaceae bacterium]
KAVDDEFQIDDRSKTGKQAQIRLDGFHEGAILTDRSSEKRGANRAAPRHVGFTSTQFCGRG